MQYNHLRVIEAPVDILLVCSNNSVLLLMKSFSCEQVAKCKTC